MKHFTKQRNVTAGALLSALRLLAILLTAILLFSCGNQSGQTTQPPAVPGELVTSQWVGTITAGTLSQAVGLLGLTGVVVNSDAACYKLTYRTSDPAGRVVNASGLVCLPISRSGGRPVISYQHGTIFQDKDAPSSFSSSGEALLGAVLTGLGYITVMPDYIGFGDSTALPHPYLHAATLASATVDLNRAARVFLAEPWINMTTNGQLFLAGYSEGGYATLATQRLMEQSLSAEFSITASEPGAGPYDLTGTMHTILGLPNQPQPAFAGFFLKAYDTLYNNPGRLTAYFTATYADTVNTYFDGAYSKNQITTALGGANVTTDALFNAAFVADYLAAGETALKSHIAENDIYNWAPATPTRLFHGQADDTVPYANATTARTSMVANGSTAVTVVDCNAGPLPTTHDNCARPYGVDMITFFGTLAAGL